MEWIDSLEDFKANGWKVERKKECFVDVGELVEKVNKQLLVQQLLNERNNAGNFDNIQIVDKR